jgi:ribosomal protein L37AE/L43A
MAKNKVQFQKGLSVGAFLSMYGTEKQCYEALFRMRWPEGYICPECGHRGFCYIEKRKVYQCNQCHTQRSVISNTIFASTKLPLTIWFLAIFFITQSKDGISSLKLARLLGISANAALRIKHKLQQTMKERDDLLPLGGLILIDDAYCGGKKHGGKRGRGASGKTPFVAAIQLSKEKHPMFIKFNKVSGFTKTEIAAWASKHILPKSYTVSDGLNCFPAIEDAKSYNLSIAANKNTDLYRKIFKWLNTVIGNVKTAIRGVYHAISDRHVPRYLAEYCYRFNRRFKLADMVASLLKYCLKTPPMPYRLLKMAEVRW